jgi:hypothetical protein
LAIDGIDILNEEQVIFDVYKCIKNVYNILPLHKLYIKYLAIACRYKAKIKRDKKPYNIKMLNLQDKYYELFYILIVTLLCCQDYLSSICKGFVVLVKAVKQSNRRRRHEEDEH